MELLFIGNSHTSDHDMPEMVHRLLEATGQKSHITMLTTGGKNLSYHTLDANTVFNIRYGAYDMVIVQERSSGFDADSFKEAAKTLKDMTDKAGGKFFLFMPWTAPQQTALQKEMTDTYYAFCRANQCFFAPVGEVFTRLLLTENPNRLFCEDNRHITALGSYAAATTIFYTITGRKRILRVEGIDDQGIALGFPSALCQKIHAEACHTTRLYNG